MPNNRMALTSLISGIVTWVLWLVFLCFNWSIGILLSMATFWVTGILGWLLSFLPVSPWIVGVVTGHVGLSQIGRTHEPGKGRR